MNRPNVSVIIPFAGGSIDAERLQRALAVLRTIPGDEVIVVDNSPEAVVNEMSEAGGGVQVTRAVAEHSSYYARNVGAATASRDWMLFMDSDCTPTPDLLDQYFRALPAERCGALAGEILGDLNQASVAARWARSRERLRQSSSLAHPFLPYGSTANLLVRKTAFDQVTGFTEGIRSGGDVDFCWRLQRECFSMEHRKDAIVTHSHRETVTSLLRQSSHYGGSQAWLDRSYGCGLPSRRMQQQFIFSVRGVSALLSGRFEDARFYGLDMADLAAQTLGAQGANRPPLVTPPGNSLPVPTICYLEFPPSDWVAKSATDDRFESGWRVESVQRSPAPRANDNRGLGVSYAVDDPPKARIFAAIRIAARYPLRAIRTFGRSRGSGLEVGAAFPVIAAAARRTRQAGGTVYPGERAAEGFANEIATLTDSTRKR